jgi:NAD-dependent SIR2 family protein deacetylase
MSAAALERFVVSSRRLLVITGAGLSAPSGIHTYRDAHGTWQRSAPIMHQAFVDNEGIRRRYWLRSMHGWPMFERAKPNPAHEALAALEAMGRLVCVVTQNVDGLHQRAGQRRLIELHGSLSRVRCLSCGASHPRAELQGWLEQHNPAWCDLSASARPDGDAEVAVETDPSGFRIPSCSCGGILKPDVVFYGGAVPRATVAEVQRHLAEADGLLVVGSSLMVYSSFRFAREASARGLPMAAINQGCTRADAWLDCKLEADCAVALPELLRAL